MTRAGAGGDGDPGDAVFVAERPRLLGLAYRMLGSITDAEDVTQDAWLRWSQTDQRAVENPAAWLTTVVTRLCLDRVRAVERRRVGYVGEWLPEPVATSRGPEESAELAESLTLGFLVLLDRLNPTERAVYLLADVFHEPYAEIATAVAKTDEACRQIASRARRKVAEGRRAPDEDVASDADLLGQLVGALLGDDLPGLVHLLDPDVVLVSDGGPDRHAARRPIVGADRVARAIMNISRRVGPSAAAVMEINGRPALVIEAPEGRFVTQIDVCAGRVVAIWAVLNPTKLHGLDEVVPLR